MNDFRRYIAIDGGGSGCTGVLCDRDRGVLARGRVGPANFFTDPDGARANLDILITDLIGQAGIAPADCAAHLGLAGMIDATDGTALARSLPFAHASVSDDRTTTLAGALGDDDGIVLSVGTGSFIAAQRDRTPTLLGGWGYLLGDQAGGARLGLGAMRATLLAHDGLRPASDMTRHIAATYGPEPLALLCLAHGATPADFAQLAPDIIAAAQADDIHAKALMQEGAAYLMAGTKAAGLTPGDRLCLTGGIGPAYAPYLDEWAQSYLCEPKGNALDGALLLARKLQGVVA